MGTLPKVRALRQFGGYGTGKLLNKLAWAMEPIKKLANDRIDDLLALHILYKKDGRMWKAEEVGQASMWWRDFLKGYLAWAKEQPRSKLF